MAFLPGHDYFLRYKHSLCVNLIFTIFAIEYGMKCTREQEKIIFDIRLISDSRKAILRNQSFKLSFNKYSLVHTFEIHRKLIYSVFKSKGFSRDNHARWVKNELPSAVENVARREIFNF